MVTEKAAYFKNQKMLSKSICIDIACVAKWPPQRKQVLVSFLQHRGKNLGNASTLSTSVKQTVQSLFPWPETHTKIVVCSENP